MCNTVKIERFKFDIHEKSSDNDNNKRQQIKSVLKEYFRVVSNHFLRCLKCRKSMILNGKKA
ncbi:MAG: hypothetical protein PHW96_02095 [Candidatus Nanoarchaeia archaeon]|nr:hypothetical protein [Candidatus Nanoarchaeia archaeon]